MKFFWFAPPLARHLKKSCEYLKQAKAKRAGHQAAAERHGALAELYAARIERLQAQLGWAAPAGAHPDGPASGVHDTAPRAAVRR
jgi:hypothetical protein